MGPTLEAGKQGRPSAGSVINQTSSGVVHQQIFIDFQLSLSPGPSLRQHTGHPHCLLPPPRSSTIAVGSSSPGFARRELLLTCILESGTGTQDLCFSVNGHAICFCLAFRVFCINTYFKCVLLFVSFCFMASNTTEHTAGSVARAPSGLNTEGFWVLQTPKHNVL